MAQALTVYDAVIEEGGLVPFTVALSPADDEMVTVTYTTSIEGGNTADAADFTTTTGVLTFYAGDQIKTVYVQTTPDIFHENNETFTLTLSDATDASDNAVTLTDATAVGTILNDDRPPLLTVPDASAVEGNLVIFTVELSGPTLSSEVVNLTYTVSTGGDPSSGTASTTDGEDLPTWMLLVR